MSVLSFDIGALSWMIPLSIFGAGLVGSPHCLAMCGPLVLGISNRGRRHLLAYNLGRGLSYTIAGLVAGTVGAEALSPSENRWFPVFSLALMSALLIYSSYRTLARRPLHIALHIALPDFFARPLARLSAFFLRPFANLGSSAIAALMVGSLTVFLPCGHLYGFLIGAAATGSTFAGGIFMLAFWLGTLPALGYGLEWLRRALKPGLDRGPRWAAALLLLAGFLSLSAFAIRLNEARAERGIAPVQKDLPHCH